MSTSRTDISPDVRRLLERGVAAGIITQEQQQGLVSLADAVPEPKPGFTVVSVAYGLGALLVLFASGWFLIDRWARLGAWGVLAVTLGYAAVLALGARWSLQRGFVLAADVATMLAVSLTPLVAWSFLSMAGRWPDVATRDPLLRDAPWMAWLWLVLLLSTQLVALLVLRRRRIVALTWPMAAALWGIWFFIGQILRGNEGAPSFERWVLLANGLAILFVAERIERWQRQRVAGARVRSGGDSDTDVAADGVSLRPTGDFAHAFWVTGLLASAVGYMTVWARADDPWKHLLPVFALGLIALSLYLRRRILLLFGVAGVLAYLAFLAEDVFREYLSFPILLAGSGVLLILLTVWTQGRFPALVAQVEAGRGGDIRALPWSAPMAALPVCFAAAMAVVALADAREEREQYAFRQRLELLRMHSGSYQPFPRPPRNLPPRRS